MIDGKENKLCILVPSDTMATFQGITTIRLLVKEYDSQSSTNGT